MSEPSAEWIEDCEKYWGRTLDGPNAHWCHDWDCLPVDDTLQEAKCCVCLDREVDHRDEYPETPYTGELTF